MTAFERLKELMFGKPRDIRDPRLFHKISLLAFLAWVGLGSDGLSSSAYGPDEAFRALGQHTYLAIFLALATALTVFIISYTYSRIIEHFPSGGGGYVVASKLLGPALGLVSGCALLVDYVLTITVSIASSADQIFSFLPLAWHGWKLPLEALAIGLLIIMNIRGVKESISLLVPVFLLFIVTHAVALLGTFVFHFHQIPAVTAHTVGGLREGLSTIGVGGLLLLFAQAYSRGAGTYTGIEAVSNGLQIMREPRVATAKRTMLYMAISLAVTAGGILLCYLLLDVKPVEGKTLNAVMFEALPFGGWFVVLALVAEGALLLLAAQTGFIDGPRVMANMALDSWLPRRFSSLSERLTMHYGVVLMGVAAVLTLFYTRGGIDQLVTMYSINVFVTFSLTQLGMCKFWITERQKHPRWLRALSLHVIGAVLCIGILVMVVVEKFSEGAWMTILVTSLLIAFCWLIRRHYQKVSRKLAVLSQMLDNLPTATAATAAELDPYQPIAALLVGGYGGLGIHSLLTIFRQFPGFYKQVVFVSVAVIDSGHFKGLEELENLKAETRQALDKYVTLARGFGLAATCRMSLGAEPLAEIESLCTEIGRQFPKATFFAGKLIFRRDTWYQRVLHNETATAIQRRLQWEGLPTVVLPVRVRA
ncbi:MAG: APC family permease [Verrucomicrobia bacterium]|nr:MAG: APC family permease [Verrucomicrobiota bacterium]